MMAWIAIELLLVRAQHAVALALWMVHQGAGKNTPDQTESDLKNIAFMASKLAQAESLAAMLNLARQAGLCDVTVNVVTVSAGLPEWVTAALLITPITVAELIEEVENTVTSLHVMTPPANERN